MTTPKFPHDAAPKQPTPLPWNVGGIFNPLSAYSTTNIWGPTPKGHQSGTMIAEGLSLPNADLIVTAVNSFEALVDALKLAEIALVNCIPVGPIPPGDGPLVQIRAALALAGTERP